MWTTCDHTASSGEVGNFREVGGTGLFIQWLPGAPGFSPPECPWKRLQSRAGQGSKFVLTYLVSCSDFPWGPSVDSLTQIVTEITSRSSLENPVHTLVEPLPVSVLPVSNGPFSFLPQDERHPKEAFLSVLVHNNFSSVCGGKIPGCLSCGEGLGGGTRGAGLFFCRWLSGQVGAIKTPIAEAGSVSSSQWLP